MAAGLALTAAALAAAGLGGGGGTAGGADATPGPGAGGVAGAVSKRVRRPVALVSAPVRIADAATVRLLRPGDRVDVITAEGGDADAKVLARGARVAQVPEVPVEGSPESGALIVLSVPRDTASSLAGAGISARLAVTVC